MTGPGSKDQKPRTIGDRLRTKAKNTARDIKAQIAYGGRYHCAGCNRDFRGYRAANAHHLATHSGRWMSKKARAVSRAMGKDMDKARRHANGWLQSAGLRDPKGNRTARARSRPELRGRVTTRDLRQQHRHDRDHERATARDRKARRAAARDHHYTAGKHQRTADDLRSRWPQRPARTRN